MSNSDIAKGLMLDIVDLVDKERLGQFDRITCKCNSQADRIKELEDRNRSYLDLLDKKRGALIEAWNRIVELEKKLRMRIGLVEYTRDHERAARREEWTSSYCRRRGDRRRTK